jgi:Domain of unknown function (DUF4424)
VKPIVLTAIVALAITVEALATPPAIANDSAAELTTGGLVFTKNAVIDMRAEQLFISTTEIHVRYVFFNKTYKDISNTVAFPMPDITFDVSFESAIPTDDPENILGFSTTAAGRSVVARIEQKALANGIDQAALLRRLGIPLAPHLESAQAALNRLPREERENLINLGLVDTKMFPRWRLKTTYFWQQTFPAQHELVIEHRYKPSLGGSVQTMLGNADAKIENLAAYRQKYCTDADFIDTVTRARRAAQSTYAPFAETRIGYILTTGANWAGPIRDFTLVVDKADATNLVSFCATGVKKISQTQFEVRKTNFVPESDLSVLILKPERP